LVNDTYGHKEGDEQIQHTADCLKRAFEGKGDVYRIGGDEFAVIMHCVTDEEIKEIFKTFDMFIKQYNIGSTIKLSMAYGFTSFNPLTDTYADDIYVRADKLMYENKVRMKGYRGRRRSDNAENVKGN
ncbi:MAG: GGDEF domain-containing protein, partial [Oscillospiraceae bacterium]